MCGLRALEQPRLLVEIGGTDWRAQQADDDEGLRMRLHRAEDEVQVVRRDALAVFLLEHVERLIAVALAIGDVGGLHFPIVNQMFVRVAARGELEHAIGSGL